MRKRGIKFVKRIEKIDILSIYSNQDMARCKEKNVTDIDLRNNESKCKSLIYHALFILGFGEILYSFLLRTIKLKKYSLIIVNDTAYAESLIKYIRKKNDKCHIIYWIWNTLGCGTTLRCYDEIGHLNKLIEMQKKYEFKIVSFDLGDCKKFNITHINQIAYRYPIQNEKCDTDIFFVGKDKNRIKHIASLSKKFSKIGLNFTYWLFPMKHKKYTESEKNILYKSTMLVPYADVVAQDFKSKALLDLVQENQNGLTWRPIEAMYYRKKLITNYENIRQYDFYRKENIFILGKDDLSTLNLFINSEYADLPVEIVNRYTYLGAIANVYYKFGWKYDLEE
jgi:hypothetical protein